MNTAIAEFDDVSFRYQAITALDGICLRLPAGQVTALLGPIGAGKTTLIKLLLGLQEPHSGHLRVLSGNPRSLAVRKRMGAMLQISGVPGTLTVTELVDLFASFYPNPHRTTQAIEMAQADELRHRRFDKLSGGERQRTLLALALVGRPDLLVLDEPGNGLDPASRHALGEIILAQAAAGVSIVLCTHDLDEAARLADQVVIMNHGRILSSGTPDELRSSIPTRLIRCRTGLTMASLRGLPGSRHVDLRKDRAEILVTDAPRYLRALLAADPMIDDLELGGADLETAFMSLVDQGEEKAA